MVLAQSGLIYVGPMQGKQQTFGLLDELVPDARALAREDALVELARRYFPSHGPATVHDFAWWAGIRVAEARLGLEGAQPALLSETIAGKEYWFAANAPSPDVGAGVLLLPGFDEYLLGYKDRSAVLPAEHAQKIVPGNNGIFRPMIVVAGQVVGTWARAIKKKAVEVTLQPFISLAGAEDQVIQAAQVTPISSACRYRLRSQRRWLDGARIRGELALVTRSPSQGGKPMSPTHTSNRTATCPPSWPARRGER